MKPQITESTTRDMTAEEAYEKLKDMLLDGNGFTACILSVDYSREYPNYKPLQKLRKELVGN